MKRLMLIDRDEYQRYQIGQSCYIHAVVPMNEELNYVRLIVKTYADMAEWTYKIVIGDDNRTPVNSDLDENWFRDYEEYVKLYLTETRLTLR